MEAGDEGMTTPSGPSQSKEPNLAQKSRDDRLLWEQRMRDVHLTRRYRKVSVILIYWEKEDRADFEKAKAEAMFHTTYGYAVREARIEAEEKNPRSYIALQISRFMHEEDGEDTLLIVYAAGHGIALDKPGQLLLTGACRNDRSLDEQNFNNIVWNHADHLIKNARYADLFLILDCCHAGRLLDARSDPIFEFLGACQSRERTPLPGEQSFTSALIWALKELATSGKPFFSSQLYEKIRRYPHKQDYHTPCLHSRYHQPRKLQLEPLRQDHRTLSGVQEATSSANDAQPMYGLRLNFLLSELPTAQQLEKLSNSLKGLIKHENNPVRQIDWNEYFSLQTVRPKDVHRADRVVAHWRSITRPPPRITVDTHNASPGHGISTGLLTPALSERTFDGTDNGSPMRRSEPVEPVTDKSTFQEVTTKVAHQHTEEKNRFGAILFGVAASVILVAMIQRELGSLIPAGRW